MQALHHFIHPSILSPVALWSMVLLESIAIISAKHVITHLVVLINKKNTTSLEAFTLSRAQF